MNPHELSRIDDSDLYFAVATILLGVEKYGTAIFALGLAVSCIIGKALVHKMLKGKKQKPPAG